LLTIVSAKSRVEKESVEFQMFLRENRFKLMANGVKPPASIFRSNSYANIDMKLVRSKIEKNKILVIVCSLYSILDCNYRQNYFLSVHSSVTILVVVIVKIIFISSFPLIIVVLYNHSFITNPNTVTNLSKL